MGSLEAVVVPLASFSGSADVLLAAEDGEEGGVDLVGEGDSAGGVELMVADLSNGRQKAQAEGACWDFQNVGSLANR